MYSECKIISHTYSLLFNCYSASLSTFWPSYPSLTFLSFPDHQSSHCHLVDTPAFQWDCWHQWKQQVSYFDTLSVSCTVRSLKEWQDEVRGAFPVILPFGLLFNNIQQYPSLKRLLTVTEKIHIKVNYIVFRILTRKRHGLNNCICTFFFLFWKIYYLKTFIIRLTPLHFINSILLVFHC